MTNNHTSFTLVDFANNIKSRDWQEITTEKVKKLLYRKEITREYALDLLKIIIEHKPENYLQQEGFNNFEKETIAAIKSYCEISDKNKELFKFLEEMVISHTWFNVVIMAIILIGKYFPEKGKKVINYKFDTNEHLLSHYLGRYNEDYLLTRALSTVIDFPIIKLYLYYKWYFDKLNFRLDQYCKRIFGKNRYFHGNFNFKIQSYAGPEAIYKKLGVSESKYQILKEFDYALLEELKSRVVTINTHMSYKERELRIYEIYMINEKYSFGILKSFFDEILRNLMKLFSLEKGDFFFSFVKKTTSYFLHVDVPPIEIEIVVPARRIKREG